MPGFDSKKHWWVILVVTSVLAVAVMAITGEWLPDLERAGMVVGLSVLGIGFVWVYRIDPERQWWAIIPGIGLFSVAGAGLADAFFGTDPENDWASVVVMSMGAAVIASVLKRPDARATLVVVSAGILMIGILMAPATWAARIGLIVATALAAGYSLWRMRATLVRQPRGR